MDEIDYYVNGYGMEKIPCILVGTKSDECEEILYEERIVSYERMEQAVLEYGYSAAIKSSIEDEKSLNKIRNSALKAVFQYR